MTSADGSEGSSASKRRVYVRRGIAHVCVSGATYGVPVSDAHGARDVDVVDQAGRDGIGVIFVDGTETRWPRVEFVSKRPRVLPAVSGRFVAFLPEGKATFVTFDGAVTAARLASHSANERTWKDGRYGEIYGSRWEDGPIGAVGHDGAWNAYVGFHS